MARSPWRALLLFLALVSPAAADVCQPVEAVACARCFAVFVMPDTQHYVVRDRQPQGAAHLDLVTRYVCQHRRRWVEPATGKTMPILMLIQLGDLVHNGDLNEGGSKPLAQWVRADAAFDNLDRCDPVVPYLVTNGNHDLADHAYQAAGEGYNAYFGPARWQRHRCADPFDCHWEQGEWFVGGGDVIRRGSRNNVGEGGSGPPRDQPGRHRAGVVRAPDGQRYLFMGLEQVFDFPPPASGFEEKEGDDSRWPRAVLDAYAGVPTVLFHHSMFFARPAGDARVRFGPESFGGDSLAPTPAGGGAMKTIWDLLVDPYPQVFLFVSGHVMGPRWQADFVIERDAGPPTFGLQRNYQHVGLAGKGREHRYGVGWNVIAAFDPDAGEIRVRSYRIDDEAAYAVPAVDLRHVGRPAATECFDTDQGRFPATTLRWSPPSPPPPP